MEGATVFYYVYYKVFYIFSFRLNCEVPMYEKEVKLQRSLPKEKPQTEIKET
jgi:hypothetical protein